MNTAAADCHESTGYATRPGCFEQSGYPWQLHLFGKPLKTTFSGLKTRRNRSTTALSQATSRRIRSLAISSGGKK